MSAVLHFPDLSSYQAGINFANSYAVIAKATEGTGYTNPYYGEYRQQARQNNVYFVAYHFLHEGNGKEQAAHYCSVVDGYTPGMVDIEPTKGSNPSIQDAVDFITECRARGRMVYLSYLPHWYWKQIGSPSLDKLSALGQWLVTSDYTSYSDNGPGWNGYGGLPVAIWQYANNVNYGGIASVDFNAFKGNGHAATFSDIMDQFELLVTGHTKN